MTHSNKQLVGFGLVVLFLGLIALLMTEIRATLMGTVANDIYTNTWSDPCDVNGDGITDPACSGSSSSSEDPEPPDPCDVNEDGITDPACEGDDDGDDSPDPCDPDADGMEDPSCEGGESGDDPEDPVDPCDPDGDGMQDSPCGGDEGEVGGTSEEGGAGAGGDDPAPDPCDMNGDGITDAACLPPVIPFLTTPPPPTTPTTPFGPLPFTSPFTSPTTPTTPAHTAAPSISPFVAPTMSPSDDDGLFPALSEPSGDDTAVPNFVMPTDFDTPLLNEIDAWFDAAFPIDLNGFDQDLDIEELNYEEVLEEDGELFYEVAGDEWTFPEAIRILEWDLYSEEVEEIFSFGTEGEGDMKEAAPSLETVVEQVAEDIAEGNWLKIALKVLGLSE